MYKSSSLIHVIGKKIVCELGSLKKRLPLLQGWKFILLEDGTVGFLRGENPFTDLVSLPLSDPDPQPHKGRHTQGQSVMSQVGKVQGDLHTKVILDLVYSIENTCHIGTLIKHRREKKTFYVPRKTYIHVRMYIDRKKLHFHHIHYDLYFIPLICFVLIKGGNWPRGWGEKKACTQSFLSSSIDRVQWMGNTSEIILLDCSTGTKTKTIMCFNSWSR